MSASIANATAAVAGLFAIRVNGKTPTATLCLIAGASGKTSHAIRELLARGREACEEHAAHLTTLLHADIASGAYAKERDAHAAQKKEKKETGASTIQIPYAPSSSAASHFGNLAKKAAAPFRLKRTGGSDPAAAEYVIVDRTEKDGEDAEKLTASQFMARVCRVANVETDNAATLLALLETNADAVPSMLAMLAAPTPAPAKAKRTKKTAAAAA